MPLNIPPLGLAKPVPRSIGSSPRLLFDAIRVGLLVVAALKHATMMDPVSAPFAIVAIGIAAFLYSSVGHAGASGYLAVMALYGVPAATMKPIALMLNLLVATLATIQYGRSGHFQWRLLWPFALGSIPFSWLGGWLKISSGVYNTVLGIVLCWSAVRMMLRREVSATSIKLLHPVMGVAIGSVIGFLSGLVGVGGGIFLSPILLLVPWATVRQTAAVSAPFILVNSAAGLLGHRVAQNTLPNVMLPFVAAAFCGGLVGSYLGANKFSTRLVRAILAIVLVIAGIKLLSIALR